jgi:hypothetical protein
VMQIATRVINHFRRDRAAIAPALSGDASAGGLTRISMLLCHRACSRSERGHDASES